VYPNVGGVKNVYDVAREDVYDVARDMSTTWLTCGMVRTTAGLEPAATEQVKQRRTNKAQEDTGFSRIWNFFQFGDAEEIFLSGT
jgi:hypothetical protein